jgi:HEAT repeat protein
LTDDLDLRKRIAEQAQVENAATAATPAVRAFQFFLVPLLIVAACVLVYAAVGWLTGSPRPAAEWLKDIQEGGPNTRNHAALKLVETLRRAKPDDPTLAPGIIAVYRAADPKDDRSRHLRVCLITCLGYLGDRRASDLLLDIARDSSDVEFRAVALDAMGAIKDPATLPDLVKLLDDSDDVVRKYAAFNVGAVAGEAKDRSVVEALKARLADRRPDVGANAAFALAYFLDDPSGTDTLKKMLDRKYLAETIGADSNASVMIAKAMFMACNAAVKLNDRSFLPLLEAAGKSDPDLEVRHVAQKAFARISQP